VTKLHANDNRGETTRRRVCWRRGSARLERRRKFGEQRDLKNRLRQKRCSAGIASIVSTSERTTRRGDSETKEGARSPLL